MTEIGTRRQHQVMLLSGVLALTPLLQGAGIVRASRELAEVAVRAGQDLTQAVSERWARAFEDNVLGELLPSEVAKQVTQLALEQIAATAPAQAAGVRAAVSPARSYHRQQAAKQSASRQVNRAPASAPPPKATLSVTTDPSDATVRIMNIRPKYRDGISLSPGRYDVMVSADGYRTKRFPLSVKAGQVAVDVELARRDGFSCDNTHYAYGGSTLGSYGSQVRIETLLENTTLYEVYSSLAQQLQSEAGDLLSNVHTDINGDFAYLSAWQGTNVTLEEIRQHQSAGTRGRKMHNRYGLERVDKDTVRFVQTTRLPQGVMTSDALLREATCIGLGEL
ncbi:hypothetical protein [Cobetia amphilecti]|uniref:hypothetical protein n=1 Tax=Cobetia amphilecti TaxID=1055104 RepID=UPI002448B10C|nr:hypothetical protein [Cobetia litoralis]MDH2421707.1 hypothetical protein [Cobetia litoralis]